MQKLPPKQKTRFCDVVAFWEGNLGMSLKKTKQYSTVCTGHKTRTQTIKLTRTHGRPSETHTASALLSTNFYQTMAPCKYQKSALHLKV